MKMIKTFIFCLFAGKSIVKVLFLIGVPLKEQVLFQAFVLRLSGNFLSGFCCSPSCLCCHCCCYWCYCYCYWPTPKPFSRLVFGSYRCSSARP